MSKFLKCLCPFFVACALLQTIPSLLWLQLFFNVPRMLSLIRFFLLSRSRPRSINAISTSFLLPRKTRMSLQRIKNGIFFDFRRLLNMILLSLQPNSFRNIWWSNFLSSLYFCFRFIVSRFDAFFNSRRQCERKRKSTRLLHLHH